MYFTNKKLKKNRAEIEAPRKHKTKNFIKAHDFLAIFKKQT